MEWPHKAATNQIDLTLRSLALTPPRLLDWNPLTRIPM